MLQQLVRAISLFMPLLLNFPFKCCVWVVQLKRKKTGRRKIEEPRKQLPACLTCPYQNLSIPEAHFSVPLSTVIRSRIQAKPVTHLIPIAFFCTR
jgi:hypothetical protein